MDEYLKKPYKIREISRSTTNKKLYGISVPPLVADKFKSISYYWEIRGNTLILKSGCSIKNERENIVA
jgi:hypothetical protein